MSREYAVGKELSLEKANEELKAGKVLISKDGEERAMIFKGKYCCWQVKGSLRNVLLILVDLSGWYIMEREDWPHKEIATKGNTNINDLRKTYFE